MMFETKVLLTECRKGESRYTVDETLDLIELDAQTEW